MLRRETAQQSPVAFALDRFAPSLARLAATGYRRH
ncbi:hypothetical protein GSH05_32520 [Burkholderia pseudomallei]|nr:hypothetical protein [Burkholderia pseudomallei]MBM5627874.1 hypothetical protein [Burkholderia pseudomallei]MBM5656174.1 hypothetical protein [Burkholderia pseudomallei]NRD86910.1 hypothetical protein [Burkholderia pseudomallei]OSP91741.1 hypothetical protein BOC41_28040 [Burkholderia pseudomallei]